jgi:hypothetical protein
MPPTRTQLIELCFLKDQCDRPAAMRAAEIIQTVESTKKLACFPIVHRPARSHDRLSAGGHPRSCHAHQSCSRENFGVTRTAPVQDHKAHSGSEGSDLSCAEELHLISRQKSEREQARPGIGRGKKKVGRYVEDLQVLAEGFCQLLSTGSGAFE